MKELAQNRIKTAMLGALLSRVAGTAAVNTPKFLGAGTSALATKVRNTFVGSAGQGLVQRINTTAKAIGGAAPLGAAPVLKQNVPVNSPAFSNLLKMKERGFFTSRAHSNLKGVYTNASNPLNNSSGFFQKGVANMYGKLRDTGKLVSGLTQGGKISSDNFKNTARGALNKLKYTWGNKEINMGGGMTGVFRRSAASKALLAGGAAMAAAPVLKAGKEVVMPKKDPETGEKKPLINRVGSLGRQSLGLVPGARVLMHPSELTPATVSLGLAAKNILFDNSRSS